MVVTFRLFQWLGLFICITQLLSLASGCPTYDTQTSTRLGRRTTSKADSAGWDKECDWKTSASQTAPPSSSSPNNKNNSKGSKDTAQKTARSPDGQLLARAVDKANFEDNGLYVVTTPRQGNSATFHWGLVLVTDMSKKKAFVYHLLGELGGPWQRAGGEKDNAGVLDASGNPGFLKIAEVKPDMQSMWKQTVENVPLRTVQFRAEEKDFTCRVWVKETLYELLQLGIIEVGTTDDAKAVRKIEAEAISLGSSAKAGARRLIRQSNEYAA